MISARTIGRLSLYRSLLLGLPADKGRYIYSHELARMAGITSALVRRDIMALGHSGPATARPVDVTGPATARSAGHGAAYDLARVAVTGNSRLGYDIRQLIAGIGGLLDSPQPQSAALVGLGNLGRAIATYFVGRRPMLNIAVAFDKDPRKIGSVFGDWACHSIDDLPRVTREKDIRVAIITVPATEAQAVADMLVRAGVTGILNFAPVRLRVPAGVYLEDMDMTMSLEKVAYFARRARI